MTVSLQDHLAAFDPTLPLARARTIPAAWYREPAVHAAEARHVFADSWQLAGRAAQVAEPGAFLTAEVAGLQILVVRGEDGVLRAFHNVCRHRAARVAHEPCGTATKLRCRYHGWTYDLAGRLRGVPEFDGVAEFRREEHGLPPLAVETWGPFVFVHAGPRPPAMREWLAPLPDHPSTHDLGGLRFAERRVYDLNCNWKVYVDNYLDGGYHVHTIHPGLAGVLDYAGYRTELFERTNVQISPLRQPDAQREDASAAAVRTGDAAHYWWIYPNLMLNLYAGVMDTNLVLPVAPDRCRVVFDFYFADPGSGLTAESIAVADRIQAEDVDVCEDVQKGLASGAFTAGRFSVRRENGGYHFHQLLARQLAGAG
jgi:choline monooxygenase